MTRTHEQELSGAAWAYLDSEEFGEKFCEGCEAVKIIPATWNEWDGGAPEEITCPAELDCMSGRCVRFARMDEIMDALETVDRMCGL